MAAPRKTPSKQTARKKTVPRLMALGRGYAALSDSYTALRPALLRSLAEGGVSGKGLGRETPAAAAHVESALLALPPHLRALFPYTSEEIKEGRSEVEVLGKIVSFGELLARDAAQALLQAKGRLADKTGDFLGRVATLSATVLPEGDANLLHSACVPLLGLAKERRDGIRTSRSHNERLRGVAAEERARREALEAENQLLRSGTLLAPSPAPAPRRRTRG